MISSIDENDRRSFFANALIFCTMSVSSVALMRSFFVFVRGIVTYCMFKGNINKIKIKYLPLIKIGSIV